MKMGEKAAHSNSRDKRLSVVSFFSCTCPLYIRFLLYFRSLEIFEFSRLGFFLAG